MENISRLSDMLLMPKLVLYAYALSSGISESEKLAAALNLDNPPQSAAEAWERYASTESCVPLEILSDEYGLSEFFRFTVCFALAAELDEAINAVVSALGGGLTPVFAARVFSASADEAVRLRSEWITSADTTGLLFSVPETLKLNSSVLRFLIGAGERDSLPRHLDMLASRIGTVFAWDDLILPDVQKSLLRHICDRVRFDGKVYDDWGYGRVTPYGRGVRALFSGPPGTGKTMAAQVIAAELSMELYRVDLSATVSKYIGETEKNLDKVFVEAKKSGGILFFDEADAIFGKRGEQKDSHDKYANMQTSFLLQRVEEYDGVVLLATNFVSNFDAAFLRRIQIRIDFPAPDEQARLAIWSGLLKSPARVADDLDLQFLAKSFQLTGSEIKNIVLAAAFIAAAEDDFITMRNLIRALAAEYGKSNRILSEKELGEYAFEIDSI